MVLYNTPDEYLFNLKTSSTSEAKRLWRKSIKDKWNNECAYCGSKENLTIDHVIPQSKGGSDFITNVVCCCSSCNGSKAHNDWLDWYSQQSFFSEDKKQKIINWIDFKEKQNLFSYKPRKNISY